MFQRRCYFVFEFTIGSVKDGPATSSRASGITSLNHEPFDVPVKLGVIVVSASAQCQEVLACLRRVINVEFKLYLPQTGMQCQSLKYMISVKTMKAIL